MRESFPFKSTYCSQKSGNSVMEKTTATWHFEAHLVGSRATACSHLRERIVFTTYRSDLYGVFVGLSFFW